MSVQFHAGGGEDDQQGVATTEQSTWPPGGGQLGRSLQQNGLDLSALVGARITWLRRGVPSTEAGQDLVGGRGAARHAVAGRRRAGVRSRRGRDRDEAPAAVSAPGTRVGMERVYLRDQVVDVLPPERVVWIFRVCGPAALNQYLNVSS